MDRGMVVGTVTALRDRLRNLALGCDNQKEEAWMDVQAADYLLEQIAKEERVSADAIGILVETAQELGRYKGMVQYLKSQHPEVFSGEKISAVDALVLSRDLVNIVKLLEAENENHKQIELPGSLSQSGRSGPLHEGRSGLQCDGAAEATTHDRTDSPQQS